MTSDQEWLARLRAGFALSLPEDPLREDCPPPEKIWAARQDELSRDELKGIIGHVAVCPVCTESWRLADKIEAGAKKSKLPWRAIQRVAAVAVATVGIMLVVRGGPGPEPVTRTAEEPVFELLSTDPALTRSSCRLRWTEIDNARYDVSVSLENLEEVSRAVGLEAPDFLVEEKDLENVPACTELLVHVEAHRLGEERLAGFTSRFRCDDPESNC